MFTIFHVLVSSWNYKKDVEKINSFSSIYLCFHPLFYSGGGSQMKFHSIILWRRILFPVIVVVRVTLATSDTEWCGPLEWSNNLVYVM